MAMAKKIEEYTKDELIEIGRNTILRRQASADKKRIANAERNKVIKTLYERWLSGDLKDVPGLPPPPLKPKA